MHRRRVWSHALVLFLLSFAVTVDAQTDETVIGVLRSALNEGVADAELTLLSSDRSVVAATRSDAQGRFSFTRIKPGAYVLVVRAGAFAEHRVPVVIASAGRAPDLSIQLQPTGFREDVTVTASRESVESPRSAGQPVNVIDAAEIRQRVKTVVAEAVDSETGVHLQRTSPTMAGVFVRGLTGNKVNVFIDGVRYSNGAQRGGVNTFLDLIDPWALDSIEVLRGPSSAQYGSDALGGSLQFLTKAPSLSTAGQPRVSGLATFSGGTGHHNGGGSVLLSFLRPTLGVTVVGSGRKAGLIRTGGGIDSHAAVTRFLGVASNQLMDERLPDTSFGQVGASVRANWTPSTRTQLVASYMRSDQDRGKRYDQLLGGDGNLISDLNALSLDFMTLRLERFGAGPFSHATFTYSLNSQREERVNQGGNGSSTATIGHEPERTTVHGVQASAARQISARQSVAIGGDAYFEQSTSNSTNVNPVTGAVSARRPRVPSGATFNQGGVWANTSIALEDNVTLSGAVRFGGASYAAHASDSPLVNGQPLWPDDALTAWSPTFRVNLVAAPSERWTVSGSISRGFRAPHMTDLGTLGLTGSGFEVAAPDVAGQGGMVGSTADGAAVSTGRAVEQVGPETSMAYEGSVRFNHRQVRSEVTFFVNSIAGNIQKQALILPPGAVGDTLGGQVITSQNANGVVFVAVSPVPVLVRANFDNARVWGIESSNQIQVGSAVQARATFTYLRTKDTETGLSPNIEGGTPAPEAFFSARFGKAGQIWWIEPYVRVAWEQTHLSSLDLGDRRTGSSRSRSSIQAFFRNGARNRGWVNAGPDGILNNADDQLILTGETLAQVQDRVLGVGVNSTSLFPTVPGYGTAGVRLGVQRGRHELSADFENLTDENYRGISWGVDAPGRGVTFRYAVKF